MRTRFHILSDILLHHQSAVSSDNPMIIASMMIRQSNTAGAWDKLQNQILHRHHYVQVIARALTPDENGMDTRCAQFRWGGLGVGPVNPEGEKQGNLEFLEKHDVPSDQLIGR